MNLTRAPGGTVRVSERADFPVNRGALCGKGRTAPAVLDPAVRLTSPLTRSRETGAPVPAGWDEALDRIATAIRPDTVFMPFHWAGEGRANTLTRPALDPTSRVPEFKVCAVRVETVRF
ncbi:hypothetical protein GCM10027073_72670 [Streptomyces chlorus]